MVLNAAVGSDASLLRGDVSESTENGAPPPRVLHEICGGGRSSDAATICERTGALLGL